MDGINKIQIAHLGLSAKDQLVLNHFLTLDEDWLANFELLDDQHLDECQILLLNVDDAQAVEKWLSIAAEYHHIRLISIHLKQPPLPGSLALKRPINIRKFSEVLKQATAKNSQSQSFGKRVLIVDDSVAVQTHMVQKLKELFDQQLSLLVADNAEDALKILDSQGADLVFLDVVMPGVDGYKCCRTIKSEYTLPVVMLTGKSSAINRVRAKMSGCDDFLAKPPKDSALEKVIRHFLLSTTSSNSDKLVQESAHGI